MLPLQAPGRKGGHRVGHLQQSRKMQGRGVRSTGARDTLNLPNPELSTCRRGEGRAWLSSSHSSMGEYGQPMPAGCRPPHRGSERSDVLGTRLGEQQAGRSSEVGRRGRPAAVPSGSPFHPECCLCPAPSP
uniref:Uncharacterized protein n=1 Tax=Myotis myotis TaxID=51298 RepID=A0A7J7VZH9_MYOMY|nr:hypothetical protein mMyoMyo1_012391 [Myotis myotis]